MPIVVLAAIGAHAVQTLEPPMKILPLLNVAAQPVPLMPQLPYCVEFTMTLLEASLDEIAVHFSSK